MVIRFGATGATLTAALLAPNAIRGLEAPLQKLFNAMDKRERQRELQRVIRYMKQRGYLAGSYEHGLQLTEKSRRRLARLELEDLQVASQPAWDKRWRVIIYDIPEAHKQARTTLAAKLHHFGCFQLQKSVWITPFPCHDDIAQLCAYYAVDQYVTYFEALNLDNETVLLRRFKKKYPATRF